MGGRYGLPCTGVCSQCTEEYVESGVYGYYKIPDAYYQAFIDWEREHHGYEVKKNGSGFHREL